MRRAIDFHNLLVKPVNKLEDHRAEECVIKTTPLMMMMTRASSEKNYHLRHNECVYECVSQLYSIFFFGKWNDDGKKPTKKTIDIGKVYATRKKSGNDEDKYGYIANSKAYN